MSLVTSIVSPIATTTPRPSIPLVFFRGLSEGLCVLVRRKESNEDEEKRKRKNAGIQELKPVRVEAQYCFCHSGTTVNLACELSSQWLVINSVWPKAIYRVGSRRGETVRIWR